MDGEIRRLIVDCPNCKRKIEVAVRLYDRMDAATTLCPMCRSRIELDLSDVPVTKAPTLCESCNEAKV